VLSPAQLYDAAVDVLTSAVFAREAGRTERTLDALARHCPGRLAALQLAEFLLSELTYRQGTTAALRGSDRLRAWGQVAALEEGFELPAAEGPDR